MSKNILFEGWLTKSPPAKRIWRAKWRRRWFSLRQSSELPGQYFLDYYADRNCRRLKGTIDLDLCEQVDAGLHMERGNGALDPKIRGSGFTIRTQSRTYYLEADCEADMEKWVDVMCRVCGLRSTEEGNDDFGPYQLNRTTISVVNERFDRTITTGPYIPISECITGSRLKDKQRTFTFDPKIVVSTNRRGGTARGQQMYMSQPHIRLNVEFSEPDSNQSDEDCKSLNASQCNIGEWSVAKSFTKLAVSPNRNILTEDGPPVPPRPPKTLTVSRDGYQNTDAFVGPRIQEPTETVDIAEEAAHYSLRRPPTKSDVSTQMSPGRMPLSLSTNHRYTDDEDENSPRCPSIVYINMPILPPAVDRALKPRHTHYTFAQINNLINNNQHFPKNDKMSDDEAKPDALQYLDLDLQPVKPPVTKAQDTAGGKQTTTAEVHHGRSLSAADTDDPYKTVDFAMTEAFNITRQDAEATRSLQLQQ